MPLEVAFAIGAASGGVLVALLALLRPTGAVWRLPLAAGTLAIAGEVAASALAVRSAGTTAAADWWRTAFACGAFVPGAWLAFSLSFARADPAHLLWRARRWLGAAFAVPVGLAVLFRDQLLAPLPEGSSTSLLVPIGRTGYALEVVQILAAVVILANLERTLRASTGSRRWLIKFIVIGVCTLFALRVYLSSQTLLFRAIDNRLLVVSAAGFVLAQLSIVVAYIRARLQPTDVYLSSTALYGSLTTMLVAAYLLAVGILAAAAGRLGRGAALPLVALVLLGAFWGLAVVLLSDEARHRLRLFVSRHFRRPLYDYRLEWRRFTERTGATLDARELCGSIAAWIAATLNLHAVSVWLVDESGAVTLGGSTLHSTAEIGRATTAGPKLASIIQALGERTDPVDLSDVSEANLGTESPVDMRFATLLRAGDQTVGLITHSARATGDALTTEDLELIKTASEQAASRLLGIRLSDRLARAREMEAFQTLSAFFVHDLKNLASRLSLGLHNLPERIEDPAFRADFVATLSRSVARIDDMCARLSLLTRRLELRLQAEDLSDVVAESLSGLRDDLRGRLEERLEPLPPVPCDREQLEKVVVNLVLNANEALGEDGTITVTTGFGEKSVIVAVQDNGCGMSPEYVATALFQPFKSTKDKGLGVGLFHSRKIVEAHGGRIEVESAPGEGSTFRVRLPLPPA